MRHLAPWWAYVVPAAAINAIRQIIVPPSEVGDAVSIALFATTTALVFLVVTALSARRSA